MVVHHPKANNKHKASHSDPYDPRCHAENLQQHGNKCQSGNSIFVKTNTSTTGPTNADSGCPCTHMIPDTSICINLGGRPALLLVRVPRKTTRSCIPGGDIDQ